MTQRRPTALDAYLSKEASHSSASRNHRSPSTQYSLSWETHFPSSNQECLEQLDILSRKVEMQEQRVREYIKDYQLAVLNRLEREYRALKAELLKILDGTFERCMIKVKEGFVGNEMGELERATKRLEEVKQKIRSFEFELEANYTYKRGIAHVVMENFEAQRAEMVGSLNNAISNYESRVFLRIEPLQFIKMKEAVNNLLTYVGSRNHPSRGQSANIVGPVLTFQASAPSFPSNTVVDPINAASEGVVPEPQLNPPFKPFPPRSASQNPYSQRMMSQEEAYGVNPNGQNVRYGQSGSNDFSEAFNRQFTSPPAIYDATNSERVFLSPEGYSAHNPPQYPSHQSNRENQVPPIPSRESSNLVNSHRNRDLIRHSQQR